MCEYDVCIGCVNKNNKKKVSQGQQPSVEKIEELLFQQVPSTTSGKVFYFTDPDTGDFAKMLNIERREHGHLLLIYRVFGTNGSMDMNKKKVISSGHLKAIRIWASQGDRDFVKAFRVMEDFESLIMFEKKC